MLKLRKILINNKKMLRKKANKALNGAENLLESMEAMFKG